MTDSLHVPLETLAPPRGISGSAERMDQCLARITEREADLQAWAWFDAAAARESFVRLPVASPATPLHGVPVGIKDIIDTVDMPTAYGSALHAGHRPREDAQVVTLLRRAGAVVMGKTVTTEFAYVHPGPTTHPHCYLHTPGGSSSGSAAAVAAGMVPLALGTQTGGSTIRPSAYCGVVGFKPTYGVVSMTGVRPLAPTLDTIGIHAGRVADAALLFGVLAERDPFDMQPGAARLGSRPLRIGLYPGPHAHDADPDAHVALELAARRSAAAGHAVQPIDLPAAHFGALSEANRTIMAYEGARVAGDDYRRGADRLGPATRALVEVGLGIDRAAYLQAVALCRDCILRFEDGMQDFDLLLTFPAPGRAPLAALGTGSSVFNRAWTSIGVPCLTLPVRALPGLPLGVQLVGRGHTDDVLLRHAAWLETDLESGTG